MVRSFSVLKGRARGFGMAADGGRSSASSQIAWVSRSVWSSGRELHGEPTPPATERVARRDYCVRWSSIGSVERIAGAREGQKGPGGGRKLGSVGW